MLSSDAIMVGNGKGAGFGFTTHRFGCSVFNVSNTKADSSELGRPYGESEELIVGGPRYTPGILTLSHGPPPLRFLHWLVRDIMFGAGALKERSCSSLRIFPH